MKKEQVAFEYFGYRILQFRLKNDKFKWAWFLNKKMNVDQNFNNE